MYNFILFFWLMSYQTICTSENAIKAPQYYLPFNNQVNQNILFNIADYILESEPSVKKLLATSYQIETLEANNISKFTTICGDDQIKYFFGHLVPRLTSACNIFYVSKAHYEQFKAYREKIASELQIDQSDIERYKQYLKDPLKKRSHPAFHDLMLSALYDVDPKTLLMMPLRSFHVLMSFSTARSILPEIANYRSIDIVFNTLSDDEIKNLFSKANNLQATFSCLAKMVHYGFPVARLPQLAQACLYNRSLYPMSFDEQLATILTNVTDQQINRILENTVLSNCLKAILTHGFPQNRLSSLMPNDTKPSETNNLLVIDIEILTRVFIKLEKNIRENILNSDSYLNIFKLLTTIVKHQFPLKELSLFNESDLITCGTSTIFKHMNEKIATGILVELDHKQRIQLLNKQELFKFIQRISQAGIPIEKVISLIKILLNTKQKVNLDSILEAMEAKSLNELLANLNDTEMETIISSPSSAIIFNFLTTMIQHGFPVTRLFQLYTNIDYSSMTSMLNNIDHQKLAIVLTNLTDEQSHQIINNTNYLSIIQLLTILIAKCHCPKFLLPIVIKILMIATRIKDKIRLRFASFNT